VLVYSYRWFFLLLELFGLAFTFCGGELEQFAVDVVDVFRFGGLLVQLSSIEVATVMDSWLDHWFWVHYCFVRHGVNRPPFPGGTSRGSTVRCAAARHRFGTVALTSSRSTHSLGKNLELGTFMTGK